MRITTDIDDAKAPRLRAALIKHRGLPEDVTNARLAQEIDMLIKHMLATIVRQTEEEKAVQQAREAVPVVDL